MNYAPSLQVRAQAELELRRRRRTTAPLATPVFRGAALAIQSLVTHEVMIAGPSETGKTYAALWRLDTLLRTTPNAQAALVRKVRVTIAPTVLRTYMRVLELSGSGARAYGGNAPIWYDYPNGARLWIGGMDDPGKVLSSERDWIYVNQAEELTEDDWQTLSTRTTGRGAVTDTPMLFGDCNPGPADHWIMRRASLVRLDSRHEDNPTLYDENGNLTEQGHKTMAVLDALTGVRYLRLRRGQWVGAEGQYFETWDEAVHVLDPQPLGRDWLYWGALDYGFAHPLAFGVFALDTLGAIHLVGEHVQHKRLIGEHADAMGALVGRLGLSRADLRLIAAGHDCWASRGGDDPETIADKFGKEGWQLTQATIDRINGWQAIQTRLGRPAEGVSPSLFVWRNCPRMIATIPAMVHDPHRPEDILKTNADSEGRGGDDAADCLRYGCMAVPGLSVTAPAVGGKRPPITAGLPGIAHLRGGVR